MDSHNKRVKFSATALHNLGVATIVAGIVVPMVNGAVGDPGHIVAWCVLGVDLIAFTRAWLGRLRG
jgi:hypothetical protein